MCGLKPKTITMFLSKHNNAHIETEMKWITVGLMLSPGFSPRKIMNDVWYIFKNVAFLTQWSRNLHRERGSNVFYPSRGPVRCARYVSREFFYGLHHGLRDWGLTFNKKGLKLPIGFTEIRRKRTSNRYTLIVSVWFIYENTTCYKFCK